MLLSLCSSNHYAAAQAVEVVLTAHPTQVNRRTLQYKHTRISALLQQHDRQVQLWC
jgi:phosphoenolpyruvate carboxylase